MIFNHKNFHVKPSAPIQLCTNLQKYSSVLYSIIEYVSSYEMCKKSSILDTLKNKTSKVIMCTNKSTENNDICKISTVLVPSM